MLNKRIGIIQSNYVPWKGYFDFINSVDEFVLLDTVQYSHHDWRNRNRIKGKTGLQWLTVPVRVTGKQAQPIDAVEVADGRWVDKHLASLRHTYARAPFFGEEWPWVAATYDSLRTERRLSVINRRLLAAICARLGITTPLIDARSLSVYETGKNERIIAICKALGATHYLSGPAAKDYIDSSIWLRNGIIVEYKSYEGYAEYQQAGDGFDHGVSILDVIFNAGPEAQRLSRSSCLLSPVENP